MNTEKQIERKIKELNFHYISYKRLVDAGLIIATTSFNEYLEAVGFEQKSFGSNWKIFIQTKEDDWLI